MNKNDLKKIKSIAELLKYSCSDTVKMQNVFNNADLIRQKYVGNTVYLRGIIEISNYCRKNCFYCGLRCCNNKIKRYRMTENVIVETAKKIINTPIKTVVLQSGEDIFWSKEKMGNLIKRLKNETGLYITLSLGIRDYDTYNYWLKCGADRYLLRFETSNKNIFKKLHPDDDYDIRLNAIKYLKKIGYETGSGFMIGLPETTFNDIAHDILLCKNLKLDMIGIGPFIPNPDTPLKDFKLMYDLQFIRLVFSYLRIINKSANIPATTALDTIDKNARMLILQSGANVFMPNITPAKYRNHYLLYPDKPCVDEDADSCISCVFKRIKLLKRKFE